MTNWNEVAYVVRHIGAVYPSDRRLLATAAELCERAAKLPAGVDPLQVLAAAARGELVERSAEPKDEAAEREHCERATRAEFGGFTFDSHYRAQVIDLLVRERAAAAESAYKRGREEGFAAAFSTGSPLAAQVLASNEALHAKVAELEAALHMQVCVGEGCEVCK